MNKKPLFFLVAVAIFLSINFISASYFFDSDYEVNDFRETTEFKQTTEQKIGDFWDFESTKRTITETTEVRKRTRTPIYNSYYRPYGNYDLPRSNWRFKEPYKESDYVGSHYNDYYYKPRYDSNLGYYNWRW
jgi:hypothetical protein|tara:strand:+ start:495 stop:890 length:396 start_codon:yes stop_codon:yes gene_type:complete